MRQILYISVFAIVNSMANELDHYDLLLDPLSSTTSDVIEVTSPDGYDSFRFVESDPFSTTLENMSYSDFTLSSPYALSTKFKLDKLAASCLFSLISPLGKTKLKLCLTPIGMDTMRISIESEGLPNNQESFSYDAVLDGWMKLVFHIEKNQVNLYMNCSDPDTVEFAKDVEDVFLSKDTSLLLAHSGSGSNFFQGTIQEIKLFTNADEAKVKSMNVCGGVKLPASTDLEDNNSDTPRAESLVAFLDKGADISEDHSEKVDKGEKGDKGNVGICLPGPEGPEGPLGPQGPPGIPGSKGEEGTCSCSEALVSTLLRSMPEMRGLPGEAGPRGETGNPGLTGLTGKQGDQGERGPEGLTGERGEIGYDGAPGRDGSPGIKGQPGKDGDSGPPGPIGPMGPPGPPGLVFKDTDDAKEISVPGERGDVGAPGVPGPKGALGEKGEKGQQGVKGEKGDEGHTGAEGSRGEKGDRGEAGRDGLAGEPGTHGRPAEKGEKGNIGDKGAPGIAGLPASLSSLLDSDLDPRENAEIVEKFRGFKGDKGKDGEKGSKGDIGPVGLAGLPGKDGRHGNVGEKGPAGPRGEQGFVGDSGPKGEPGEPGSPGNVSGSNIALVKGLKGEKGEHGIPGKLGVRGFTGNSGKKGPVGPKGTKGDSGATGPMGLEGPRGATGEKGLKGEGALSIDVKKLKGEKGDRGDNGKPGEQGKIGPPGLCSHVIGENSQPGPPGPPGPSGLSITGPKGEPGGFLMQKTYYSFTDGSQNDEPDNEDDFYTTMTVIYKTTSGLIKRTSSTPLGTLAYVLQEKTLLMRVENGWQYIVMGSMLESRKPNFSPSSLNPLPSRLVSSTPLPSSTVPSHSDRIYIRMIALNAPYSGKMYSSTNRTGRNGANYDCHIQARKYRIPGNFVAFLANKVEDLRYLVKTKQDEDLPVVNLYGEVLFDSWSSMFNGSGALFKSQNIYSFNRKNIAIDPTWPKKAVWHGGDLHGIRSEQVFCDEWQSDNPSLYGTASSLHSNRLLDQERYACNNELIVLCVEATAPRRTRHSLFRSRRKSHYTYDNRIPTS